MGKYQLDDKGKALVARYHEKNSNVKQDKKARVQELLKQAKIVWTIQILVFSIPMICIPTWRIFLRRHS
ncbi:TPA: hypothetical protein U2B77_000545 [Streptococcus suis]|nr:hypothetical protein [Streptococcus suis]